MSDTDIPPFNEAISRFRKFISEQGHEATLRWVFREDIAEFGFRIFIRLPLPDSEQLVERLYQKGLQEGIGIHLGVYNFLNGQPLCYIWLPKNERDALNRMLSGLKFSVPTETEQYTVVGIRSRLCWTWLRWRERRTSRHGYADSLFQNRDTQIVRQ